MTAPLARATGRHFVGKRLIDDTAAAGTLPGFPLAGRRNYFRSNAAINSDYRHLANVDGELQVRTCLDTHIDDRNGAIGMDSVVDARHRGNGPQR